MAVALHEFHNLFYFIIECVSGFQLAQICSIVVFVLFFSCCQIESPAKKFVLISLSSSDPEVIDRLLMSPSLVETRKPYCRLKPTHTRAAAATIRAHVDC